MQIVNPSTSAYELNQVKYCTMVIMKLMQTVSLSKVLELKNNYESLDVTCVLEGKQVQEHKLFLSFLVINLWLKYNHTL